MTFVGANCSIERQLPASQYEMPQLRTENPTMLIYPLKLNGSIFDRPEVLDKQKLKFILYFSKTSSDGWHDIMLLCKLGNKGVPG
jgi:hypothetical protein